MKKTSQEIVAGIDAQISKLTARKNAEIQKQKKAERDARASRLVKRGGILESLIEDAKTFTNDQIHTLLKEALESDVAQVILMEMREQNAIAAQLEQERIAALAALAESEESVAMSIDENTTPESEEATEQTAATPTEPQAKPTEQIDKSAHPKPAEVAEQNPTSSNENPTWTTGQIPNSTTSKPDNAPHKNQTPTSKSNNNPTNNRNQNHNNNRNGEPKQGVTPSN